jgi:hypothetical protein
MDATPEQTAVARTSGRLVLIIGAREFRCGYLRDIVGGGFEKDGYQAALPDGPEMPHTICDSAALRKALDFIEQK